MSITHNHHPWSLKHACLLSQPSFGIRANRSERFKIHANKAYENSKSRHRTMAYMHVSRCCRWPKCKFSPQRKFHEFKIWVFKFERDIIKNGMLNWKARSLDGMGCKWFRHWWEYYILFIKKYVQYLSWYFANSSQVTTHLFFVSRKTSKWGKNETMTPHREGPIHFIVQTINQTIWLAW